ncbi:class I adenylate-forming enzyme family protein [Arthrobacter sp. NPDC057013]|uniref:class I adenylate-forming enzyme family protein n=1 Tax=Arthrobacter sp. NPDC057013 TaxID=3345999 RepID=UPI0036372AD8
MTNRMLTRLDLPQAHRYYAEGHWQDETIYGLARKAATLYPDETAVMERSRNITYRSMLDAVDRLAGHLADAGLTSGDRVAIWLPSRAEVAVALLACSRNGYIACPALHRDHTVGDVLALTERIRAKAFIGQHGYGADSDRADIFTRLDEVESVRTHIRLGTAGPDTDLFPTCPPRPARTAPHPDPDSIVYLAFTSGTTGLPKGVMHSSNTLLAPVRALAKDWDLAADMVIYSLSPLSHNLGFGAMLLALTGGGTLVAHDLRRGESVAHRIASTGATFVFGVPTHAIDLLAELERGDIESLPELKGFRISGAAIPTDVAERLIAAGVVPQSGYGMTEAGSHHYTLPDDGAELIVGTSGRPFGGHEARIVDRENPSVEVPAGTVGQIVGRGPSVMLGYFDDQTATETSFTHDSWFLTGDLGWVDDAGYIRITGRKKDVIIRGGHNIFPAKIENLASRFEAVGKAAAIPVRDSRLGERVCLVVTRAGLSDPDPEDLLAFLDKEGLSKYDMPEFLQVVDSIPLLPSGKLDKRSLVAQVDSGEITPTPIRFTAAVR